MRPTATRQSALKAPLNDILSTEANVRILRVLSQSTEPMTAAVVGRQTSLQPSTIHRSLKALELTGVIEFSGARTRVALRGLSPMAAPLRELFQAERTRAESILAELRAAAKALTPPPIAVWMEGKVARGTDRPGDPVIIGFVGSSRGLAESGDSLRRAFEAIEKRYDVTIEIRGRTMADITTAGPELDEELAAAVPLAGLPVGAMNAAYASSRARNIRAHADHDRNLLARGEQIAEAIRKDPAVIERARTYIQERWSKASAAERRELSEWRSILESTSPARLRKILTDPGERSTRLRQTLPFLGLTDEDSQ